MPSDLYMPDRNLLGSSPYETEGMTCWVGQDPTGVGIGLVIELGSAVGENGRFCHVDVIYPDMEVALHRRGRIGPDRRFVFRGALEGQMKVCVVALTNRPPIVRCVDDLPTGDQAVELGESGGVSALQGDPAELAHWIHRLSPFQIGASAAPFSDDLPRYVAGEFLRTEEGARHLG